MKKGFFAGLLLLALSLSTAWALDSKLEISQFGRYEYRTGEILVKLKNNVGTFSSAQTLSKFSSLGFKVLRVEALVMDNRLAKIKLADSNQLLEALTKLNQNPAVEYAEPNYIYRALDSTPNDPEFGKLWGMKNTGQKDPGNPSGKFPPKDGTAGSDIHVNSLWERGFRGSRKIVVAVIDTGVNWNHPDLKDHIFTNPGEEGKDLTKDNDNNGLVGDIHGWNFAANTADSNDDQGHGTHCSGTIGGRGDNGIGVVGVNWDVTIMPLKFLTKEGTGSTDGAVNAIKYATKMKVHLMSNSWGGGPVSKALEEAIKEARNAGILFVAAAGNNASNNDSTPTYPASYDVDNILVVGASDNQDKLASFSNFGKRSVHVTAPGVNIFSLGLKDEYAVMSGTSMATPHVAGIAALLMSANSTWDYKEIKRRIIASSDPVASLRSSSLSHGRVNAANAYDGIFPPNNDPDPAKWQDYAFTAESKHPYDSNLDVTYKVSIPNAKFVRIHFEKVDVDQMFDSLQIETPSGEVVEKVVGAKTDTYTDYITGGEAVIRLKSFMFRLPWVTAWGFKIDKVQVIY